MSSTFPSLAPSVRDSTVPSTSASSIHDQEKPLETRPLSPTVTRISRDKELEYGGEPLSHPMSRDSGAKELEAAAGSPPEDLMEYPKGLRLAGTVVALILSIFLVALDMTIVSTLCVLKVPSRFVAERTPNATRDAYLVDSRALSFRR